MLLFCRLDRCRLCIPGGVARASRCRGSCELCLLSWRFRPSEGWPTGVWRTGFVFQSVRGLLPVFLSIRGGSRPGLLPEQIFFLYCRVFGVVCVLPLFG